MLRQSSAPSTPDPGMRHFTDRLPEQQVVQRLIELPDQQNLPVVLYYGEAGIGKSSLLRKMRANLPAGFPSALLDLDPLLGEIAFPADQARALAELRIQFGEVDCPRFDLAYSCLRFRQGGGRESLLQCSDLAGKASKVLTEMASRQDFDLPFPVTFLERLLALLEGENKSRMQHWLQEKNHRQDILHLYGMASEEIHLRLASRLLQDLEEGLAKPPGRACRGVIFLDTIEALKISAYGVDAHSRGHWLLDLHHADSSILLVLAGREPLPQKAWSSGDRRLEMIPLQGISSSAARHFFTESGVTEPQRRDWALNLSTLVTKDANPSETLHHSFAMSLCADYLHFATAIEGTGFTTAPDKLTTLARKFFISLSSNNQAWLSRLALTCRFDDHAASASHPAPEDISAFTWQELCSLCFLRPTQTRWWSIKAPLRHAFQGMHPDESEIHQFWHQHWKQRSQNSTDAYAALAWYHQYCLNPETAKQEWNRMAQSCRQAGQMADHYWLLSWWDCTGLTAGEAPSLQTADALIELATGYSETALGLRAENLLRAIRSYEAALHWFTEKEHPRLWAEIQHDLGIAYEELQVGNRAEILHKAIACHEAALRVHSETTHPEVWAATQDLLGDAYAELPLGDHEENLHRAIEYHKAALRVFTEQQNPREWAGVMNNLGTAYAGLASGDRTENLHHAITCYEGALRAHALYGDLDKWAVTQNNLGVTYKKLPSGDRSVNLRKAIACYEAALGVHTEAAHPAHWASAQNNLGAAYTELPSGNRMEHLRRAITCYEAALRVHTESEHPTQWGVTQNNMGAAYTELSAEDPVNYLQRAIECFEAALRVRTEAKYPAQWAATQNNLGIAYADLTTGDREKNLQRAITHHKAALRIFTEVAHPQHWATTQNFLAASYMELTTGNRIENLRCAVDAYEAALRVYKEANALSDWSIIQANLGFAFEELAELDKSSSLGQRALACYQAAHRGYEKGGYQEEAESIKEIAEQARKKFLHS